MWWCENSCMVRVRTHPQIFREDVCLFQWIHKPLPLIKSEKHSCLNKWWIHRLCVKSIGKIIFNKSDFSHCCLFVFKCPLVTARSLWTLFSPQSSSVSDAWLIPVHPHYVTLNEHQGLWEAVEYEKASMATLNRSIDILCSRLKVHVYQCYMSAYSIMYYKYTDGWRHVSGCLFNFCYAHIFAMSLSVATLNVMKRKKKREKLIGL